jgi:hypothetical protein
MLWWLCFRCYAALLRCVHLLISDPKGSLEEHVRPVHFMPDFLFAFAE